MTRFEPAPTPTHTYDDVREALTRLGKLARDAGYRAPEAMRPIHVLAAEDLNLIARYFGLRGSQNP